MEAIKGKTFLIILAFVLMLGLGCGGGLVQNTPVEEEIIGGWDLQEKGQWDKAIKRFDQAITLFNQGEGTGIPIAKAYSGRGHSFLELGEYQRAIEDLDQSISLEDHVDSAGAIYYRGIAYKNVGQYEMALNDLNKSIALWEGSIFADTYGPQAALAYTGRGNVYLDLGQYYRAIQDFEDAIRVESQPAEAHAGLAKAYVSVGEVEEANRHATQAEELSEKDSPIITADRWVIAFISDAPVTVPESASFGSLARTNRPSQPSERSGFQISLKDGDLLRVTASATNVEPPSGIVGIIVSVLGPLGEALPLRESGSLEIQSSGEIGFDLIAKVDGDYVVTAVPSDLPIVIVFFTYEVNPPE